MQQIKVKNAQLNELLSKTASVIEFNDHFSFLRFIQTIRMEHENRYYLMTFSDDCKSVVCVKANSAFMPLSVEFIYTFENEKYFEIMKQILNITDAEKADPVYISCTYENYYQFIANPLALQLVFAKGRSEVEEQPLYREFQITSKNGKVRDIIAPNEIIKPALQSLNGVLQKTYDTRNADFQVAYKKGKSIVNNAEVHKGNKYMFKLDIHDFFPSCKQNYVEQYLKFIFKNSINPEYLKKEILDCILVDGALSVGNPVAGTLANVIISRPVAYIKNMCDKAGIKFTVYADDMTFSSQTFLQKETILNIFNQAFESYNMQNDFTLNEKKIHGCSGTNISATGVVIREDNKLTCHRDIYQTIRQTLYQLNKGDESHYNYNKLSGQIAFMYMVDQSGKLEKLLKKYENIVKKYSLFNMSKLTEE